MSEKNSWFSWMDDKHRLVVVNDETFKEERSFRLTPLNVFFWLVLLILFVGGLTVFLMVFTPLGNIVPKPAPVVGGTMRGEIDKLYIQIDSMEKQMEADRIYKENLERVVNGDFEYEKDVEEAHKNSQEKGATAAANGGIVDSFPEKSDATKNLMESVANERELGALVSSSFTDDMTIDQMRFVTPIKGIISDTFAPSRAHYGTDIVAPKGSVIKSVQKGMVIMATWSADTGHMIGVQHENNMVSFYKHNSSVLKKMGDMVSAGEAVAIIGNTGEMTDGPHLHFELWYNQQPVNPQRYIQF